MARNFFRRVYYFPRLKVKGNSIIYSLKITKGHVSSPGSFDLISVCNKIIIQAIVQVAHLSSFCMGIKMALGIETTACTFEDNQSMKFS